MTKFFENQTLAALMEMVPDASEGKLPTKKSLADKEVLVSVEIDGANITIYKNGYLVYTVGEDSTVCTVHRCAKRTYEFSDGSRSTVSCVNMPWYAAIDLVCAERLDTNRQERESSKIEFHHNGDGTDWCDKLSVPDSAFLIEEEEAEREHERNLARLREVKTLLTPRQAQIVDLYYSSPDMTEQKVADILGDTTQQGVHKVLEQALKKLKKNF